MITILTLSIVICLTFGVPIAFSLGFGGLVALIVWQKVPLEIIVQRMFTGNDSFPLLAIPFFILAGELMNTAGIMQRLLRFANVLVGNIRGGLAQINIIASMFFGGISGSAVADASALGSVLIPPMAEEYDIDFASAITASAAVIGAVIPPSITMVVYGVVAGNVSIGGLFVAGIIPGILIGFGLMTTAYFIARKKNYKKKYTRITFEEIIKSFGNAFIALLMPVIILGGILGGIFTPTEAAAVSVAYALFVGFIITRELTFRKFIDAFLKSGITTGAVMLLIGTANTVAWILSSQLVPQRIANFISNITSSQIFFLTLVNIFLLIVGCLMETGAAQIMFTPILAPMAVQFGIDPLHFGIIVVINLVIGMATPPVGTVLFVVCGISRISIERISRAIWPFLAVEIGILLLVTYFPGFFLFLPRLVGY